MNPESIKDFILRLNDYPYILVNQKDYNLFISRNDEYLSGGILGRSIPTPIMDYITRHYIIVNQYNRPKNIDDVFLPDFYILGKSNIWMN